MHMSTCICEGQKTLDDVISSGNTTLGVCLSVCICGFMCVLVCVECISADSLAYSGICVCLHSLGGHMYIGICVYTYVSRSKGKHVFVVCVSGTYLYVDVCVCVHLCMWIGVCRYMYVCKYLCV